MGRTKEFREGAALTKAMHVFWEKGYDNSSLKELLDEMGILNGSFYHAYRSKKNLFLAALKFYEDDFAKKRCELFNSDLEFKIRVRYLFTHVFNRQNDAVCPRGCFLFNSVSSESIKDLDIYKLVQHAIEEFEGFLEVEIRKAVQKGEVAAEVDPKITAALLIAYMQGMMNLSVLNYDDVKFRKQTEYFLTSLGI